MRIYIDRRWATSVLIDEELGAAIQSASRVCGYNGAVCLFLRDLIEVAMYPPIFRILGRGLPRALPEPSSDKD